MNYLTICTFFLNEKKKQVVDESKIDKKKQEEFKEFYEMIKKEELLLDSSKYHFMRQITDYEPAFDYVQQVQSQALAEAVRKIHFELDKLELNEERAIELNFGKRTLVSDEDNQLDSDISCGFITIKDLIAELIKKSTAFDYISICEKVKVLNEIFNKIKYIAMFEEKHKKDLIEFFYNIIAACLSYNYDERKEGKEIPINEIKKIVEW